MAIGLPDVQELMRRFLEDDLGKKTIEVEGATVEEALQNAAVQLGCPMTSIEYVTLEQGSRGMLGLGKKSYRLRASQIVHKKIVEKTVVEQSSPTFGGFAETAPIERDRDGQIFVRLAGDGALLKVGAPVGRGRRVSERQAIDRLHSRAIHNFDEELVKKVVKTASGEYVKVGEFIANPANDALVTYEVIDQEMRAQVILSPPGPGGCDLSKDAILYFMRNNKITVGLKMDVLQSLEDEPRYKEPVVVAEGERPQNGSDAHMQFFFETDRSRLHLKETSDGRVNFKELGLIQNVVAGQPLAKKLPAERGIAGKTVLGRVLPAKNGKDIQIPVGKNCHIGDDGLTVLADINGEVTYIGGRINVETVKTIEGDLNIKVGNQMFLGTIIIRGNVDDGFVVKASGDIEVFGTVGRSELVAEGEVIVHQGITGKQSGVIRAGKSVWARFIENATVEAGDYVVASDGIVNSIVTANKKIVCHGRRASIVGGQYRACEEVNAKSLGSPVGGAETVVEVGFDPKSKEKMERLVEQANGVRKIVDELEKNIATYNSMRKQGREIPPDKAAVLEDNIHKHEELVDELRNLSKEIEGIQNYLNGLKVKGKISVSQKIYPGVKICIKDVREDIRTEQRAVTFYLDNMLIKTTKYEEIEDEMVKRGPRDADKTD